MAAKVGTSQATTAVPQIKERHQLELHGIEVLRFLCALSVLVFHYQHLMFRGVFDNATSDLVRPRLPFYTPLGFLYAHGAWAVQVFWVISGFILYCRYAEWIQAGRVQLWQFAVNRFSRLYPLHLVTLLAVAVLQFFYMRSHGSYFIYGDNSRPAFVEQLFFASNWLRSQPYSFNAPIWSVSVEVLVYGVFFFIARAAGGGPAIALAVCIGGYAASVLLQTPISSYVWECLSFFFAGGLTYWLWHEGWAAGMLVIIAVGILSAVIGHIPLGSFGVMLMATWLVLAFASLGRTAVVRRAAFLGNATYSLYLAHFPAQLILVQLVDMAGWGRTIFLSRLAFVFYLLLIAMVSLALYQGFERPTQNWLRRMLLARRGAGAAVKTA